MWKYCRKILTTKIRLFWISTLRMFLYLRAAKLWMLSSRKRKVSSLKSSQASKEFLTAKSLKWVTKLYLISQCRSTPDFQNHTLKGSKIRKLNFEVLLKSIKKPSQTCKTESNKTNS